MTNRMNPKYDHVNSIRKTDRLTGEVADPEKLGISCPNCGASKGRVRDARPSMFDGVGVFYRRRLCEGCGQKWTTFEISEFSIDGIKKAAVQDLIEQLRRDYL